MANRPWTGKTVVIVDDSAAVREDLRGVFEAIGMQVVAVAENGVLGLAAVRQHKPELVSLDVIMPEMDGIECYRKIRAQHPEVKCVMISWLGAEAKILDNLKETIPTHIWQSKPVNTSALEARLELVYAPAGSVVMPALPKTPVVPEDKELLTDLGIKAS